VLRKYVLFSLVILIIFFVPTSASATITLNNLSSSTIKASDDYATDTFSDSWDMTNTEDVWPVYSNVSNATFANGYFSGTTKNTDPQVYFLWGGYPGSIDSGRDGKNRPINTSTYSQVAIRMYFSDEVGELDRTGTAQLYWFYEQDTSINYANVNFPVSEGWHTYILNNVSGFDTKWTDRPITLRVDPINISGANFTIDWVQVGKASEAIAGLSWADTVGGGDNYEAFIDDDQSGYDGTSLGTAPISATSANFSLQSIAPGSYFLYLKKNNGSSPEYSTSYIPVTINKPPTVKITEPDVAGGSDWATEVLGDAWDMSNSADVSGTKNITGRGFSNGNYTAVNTNNDPIVYLNFHGQKIDTSRYHRLSVKYKFDDTFNLVRGTMARAGWSKTFSKGWQMTDDLLTYEGWNTLSLSLKGASLDVGNYGWQSQMSYFRFDPHEDPQQRRFYLDYIRIAADDELTNRAFDIKYTASDTDNSSLTLTLNVDLDTTPGNGNEQTIYSGAVGVGDGIFKWAPDSSFNGDYYIQASVNDGIAGTSSYSTGPLHIDTYKPQTYGKTVKARRASKKSAPRYLNIYKAYKTRYKKEKKQSLRKKYKKAADKYYKAYRQSIKQIATAYIPYYVKDPYSDKAYTKVIIQKRVYLRSRAKLKAHYFNLYKLNKGKYIKSKNSYLRKRYLSQAKIYYRRWRNTKTFANKAIKIANFGWLPTSRWRTYKYSTNTPGTYGYIIYARDRAGNTQQQVRSGTLIIR
jgi:hypothetical protein